MIIKYQNTEFLRNQFQKDGTPTLAQIDILEVNAGEFERHLEDINRTSTEREDVRRDRAAYRCLTHDNRPKPMVPSVAAAAIPVQQLAEVRQLLAQHQRLIGSTLEWQESLKKSLTADIGSVSDDLSKVNNLALAADAHLTALTRAAESLSNILASRLDITHAALETYHAEISSRDGLIKLGFITILSLEVINLAATLFH